LVKVNGKTIKIGDSADNFKDRITIEGRPLSPPRKIYLAFNKPPDCLTTLSDPKGRKTILDYVKIKERVIPVGRLDFKTQGLLFLTNDGDFANQVMHPRYEVEKTYMVFLDSKFLPEHIKKVKEGMDLEEFKVGPAKVRYASPAQDVIELTLHQGQNRVVRKMMEALGLKVKKLIRTKVGNVELGSIAVGKWRKMGHSEVEQFMRLTAQPKKEETSVPDKK
ncbi:pseudouridine synthase, partial [Candidatus Woesearchaeota archaeon]|nr:pseudouridine synthase [Candidatus Woesearchaeota archaeon]